MQIYAFYICTYVFSMYIHMWLLLLAGWLVGYQNYIFEYLTGRAVYWCIGTFYCCRLSVFSSGCAQTPIATPTQTQAEAHTHTRVVHSSFSAFCCSLASVWVCWLELACLCVGVFEPFSWQQWLGDTNNCQSDTLASPS